MCTAPLLAESHAVAGSATPSPAGPLSVLQPLPGRAWLVLSPRGEGARKTSWVFTCRDYSIPARQAHLCSKRTVPASSGTRPHPPFPYSVVVEQWELQTGGSGPGLQSCSALTCHES